MSSVYSDEELRGYSPEQVAGYLDKLGWSADGNFGEYGTFYRAPSGERALVSAKPRSIKYPSRVQEVIVLVAEEHGYSLDTVYRDLRYLRHDIARLRASSHRGGNTLLPDEFASLAQGAKTLINDAIDAALTDNDDRRRYRDAMIGIPAVERGSFTIPMIGPSIPFAVQPGLLSSSDAGSTVQPKLPVARRVTEMLRNSVLATRNAVDEYKNGNHDAFADAENKSIRRSTCVGLYDALGSLNRVRCEILESVLPGMRLKPPFGVTFASDDAEPLHYASDFIRKSKWVNTDQVEVNGYIRRCDKRRQDEEGKVTLKVLMADFEGEQTVHMQLGPDQFDLAVDLFRTNADVEAIGWLEQRGKTVWNLEDARVRRRTSSDWDHVESG